MSTGNSANKRDEIRAKIFAGKKPTSITVTLFGADIEIRRPTLGVILEAQNDTDRRKALFHMMVNYCYVPGTNDKVFDEADFESVMGLEFGPDLSRFNDAVRKLTEIDVLGEEKNSVGASSAKTH